MSPLLYLCRVRKRTLLHDNHKFLLKYYFIHLNSRGNFLTRIHFALLMSLKCYIINFSRESQTRANYIFKGIMRCR